jgi:hypothetical protein
MQWLNASVVTTHGMLLQFSGSKALLISVAPKHTHTHTRTHKHTQTRTRAHTHTYTHTRTRTRTHTHSCARTRARTHTHTHTNAAAFSHSLEGSTTWCRINFCFSGDSLVAQQLALRYSVVSVVVDCMSWHLIFSVTVGTLLVYCFAEGAVEQSADKGVWAWRKFHSEQLDNLCS